jgi:hypothetical protein
MAYINIIGRTLFKHKPLTTLKNRNKNQMSLLWVARTAMPRREEIVAVLLTFVEQFSQHLAAFH